MHLVAKGEVVDGCPLHVVSVRARYQTVFNPGFLQSDALLFVTKCV